MISKFKGCFCVALTLSILSAQKTFAQPGGGWIYRSLEARIAEAPVVFRGTIANVSETLIHTNNQFARAADSSLRPQTFDLHNYKITLTVDEVLKGKLERKPIEFTIDGVGDWPDLKRWADEQASFLWFVNGSMESIGTNFFAGDIDLFLETKASRQANDEERKKFSRLYAADMTILSNSQQILKRARAFAKKAEPLQLHSIYLPQQSSSAHYFFKSYLVVPVEPSLEKMAKHLIAAPDDFISTNRESASVPAWRCDLRAEGVNALRYFKSAQNIKLLKSLLSAPDFWEMKDWSREGGNPNRKIRTYSVRKMAYEVLKEWGVDVPQPVLQETVSVDGIRR